MFCILRLPLPLKELKQKKKVNKKQEYFISLSFPLIKCRWMINNKENLGRPHDGDRYMCTYICIYIIKYTI